MARLELVWSPIHQDQFILWGTEIRWYRIEEAKSPPRTQYLSLGGSTAASLISTPITNIPYIKCVAWCPDPENDADIAVGQTTGRVAIVDLRDEQNVREFSTKHPRPCNALSWSPLERRLLATGFEKHRSDHAIVIWDVNKAFSAPKLQKYLHTNLVVAPEPSYRIGESDSAQSLSWLKQGFSLIAGMGGKSLKIFDVRAPAKPEKVVSTRCVNGICLDPLDEYRLASHGDCVVSVWDLRHFDKPLLSITTPKTVVKAAWSPTRPNELGYLLREQSSVGVCDIHFCASASEDQEPSVLERDVSPAGELAPLVSFAWHPVYESRMLTCSISEKLIDFRISDRITMNWSPTSTIAWNHGRKILRFINDRDECYTRDEDISVKMRLRASKGYGIKEELLDNAALVEDPDIQSVWRWLSYCRSSESKQSFRGIRFMLGMEGFESFKSEVTFIPWSGLGLEKSASLRTFRSPLRDAALTLCGWTVDLESQIDDPSRLASLAIFNGQLEKAVRILNEAARRDERCSTLDLVALALSGFSGESSSLWREMCISQAKLQINPYLKSMFLFLTCDPQKYNDIVEDPNTLICDRIAFALKYLSDSALIVFIENLTAKFIEEGNLGGLLLTGFSKDGLTLLQNYIDRTGDVQSVVLLLAHSEQIEALEDSRAELWIESYRGLLDQWRLWSFRAQLDLRLNQANALERVPQQVFLSCNFCSKSIVPSVAGKGKNNPKNKISTCPSCGKPLPRCSVCLSYVGVNSRAVENAKTVNSQFDSWISWCQSCRHGGHAGHLLEWFMKKSECPVSGCVCRCMSLDSNPRMETWP